MGKKISQITAEETSAFSDADVFEGEESGGTSFKILGSVIKSTIATYLASLAQTLTNKTINLTSNTLTGTTAQFNTALSDNNFATLAGAETLTNKLMAPNANYFGTDYKISVTVSSNNLIVALKDRDGNDPSAASPLWFFIDDTWRSVTSALSITIAAATNWYNAGGAELATKIAPYFVYVLWDSNSSAVALTVGRKSGFRLVSDTSATTTNENHIYGYSGFTSTDPLLNIGYFEATLSAGAGYTWTVPTFTNKNLMHRQTYESVWFDFVPTVTGYTATVPTNVSYKYKVNRFGVDIAMNETTNGTSNSTATSYTLPFLAVVFTQANINSPVDNGAGVAHGVAQVAAGSNVLNCYKQAFAAWTNANAKRMNNIVFSMSF